MLIVPLTRPLRARIDHHLCTEDAADLIEGAEPELAVLNHMGLKLLREDPEMQAEWIFKKSGVRTVVGQDLMRIRLTDRLTIKGPGEGRSRGRRGRRRGRRRGPGRPAKKDGNKEGYIAGPAGEGPARKDQS